MDLTRYFRSLFFISFFWVSVFSSNVLSGQVVWEDSCSGISIQRQITPSLGSGGTILVCLGDTFSIEDQSIDELHGETLVVRYRVDGSSYTSQGLLKDAYSTVGDREVEFEVSNDSGCAITSVYTVKVLALESQISVNDASQCLSGNEFNFQALHTQLGTQNLQIVETKWNLVGLLDTQASQWSYSFLDDGDYQLTLEVNTSLGCKSVDTLTGITVLPGLYTQIRFDYDSLFCYQKGVNDTLVLSGSVDTLGTSGVDVQALFWQRGQDIITDSTFTYVFDPNVDAYGNQHVLYSVETVDGCVFSDTVRFYIAEPPRIHMVLQDSIVCKGLPFKALNNTNSDAQDPIKSVAYVWNSIDTSYSLDASMSYFPSDTGVYSLQSWVVSTLGCKDSVQNILGTSAYTPLAQISYAKTQICEGDTSSLYFDAIGPIKTGVQTKWYFDYDVVSSDSFLVFKPANPGLGRLVYQVESSEGCKDSTVIKAGIVPQPEIDIVRTNFDTCLRNVQRFSARNKVADARLVSVVWSFDDSTQIFDTVASKAFVKTGNNTIKVKGTDFFGCSDSAEWVIVVSTPPTARFVASSLTACEDKQKFNFYDSSITSVGTIANSNWIFSDGTVVSNPSSKTVSHTFQSAGTFVLSLAVTNSLGCVDTFRETITVSAKPTADFTVNSSTQCLNSNNYTFNNVSTANSAQTQLQYFWNFGDSTTSTQIQPTKKYSKAGNYSISLVATSVRGCTDSIKTSVAVLGLPTAKYGLNNANQCLGNQSFVFTDSSVNNSGSGSIISREWFFGDNTSQTGSSATKVYANAGTYQFQLRTTLSNGCFDSILGTAVVNPKPRAIFSVNKDTQCINGNNFIFDNKSSIVPGGGSVTYDWTFADTIKSTATHPNVSFTNYGNFKAVLKSTSQFGCIDTFVLPLQVTASPKVDFTSPKSLQQCNKIDTFQLQNTTDSLNGRRLTFNWTLGDGSSYNTANIQHSFQNPGTYDIVLRATNSLGCSDSIKKIATVYPDPEVDFSDNGLQQCFAFQDFKFTNNSKIGFNGGTLSYLWKLDLDSVSNNSNYNQSNLLVGDYNVTLWVTTSNGCKDSLGKKITVLSSPEAQFLINDTTQCLQANSFVLDNTSTGVGSNPTYQWIFGDGTGSKNKNFNKSYSSFGSYKVSLIASTDRGCSDTIEKQITVFSTPKAEFMVSDSALCLSGNTFKFTSLSTNGDSSALGFTWVFDQGKKFNGDTVTYGFSLSGKYLVKLIAESVNGCLDSALKYIEVYPQPQSLFSVSKPQQCLTGNLFAFKNLSNISNNSTLTSTWDLGDGTIFSKNDTQYRYKTADTFLVSLRTVSVNGCSDTFISNVFVNPQPLASFNTSDTGFCLRGNAVQFTNTSTISSGIVRSQWNFGDGRTSSGDNPVNKYGSDGTYGVTLQVTSNLGCIDTITRMITIFPNPEGGFKINSNRQCFNQNQLEVFDTSRINKGNFSVAWNFGDGQLAAGSNAIHQYSAVGDYAISQVTTSDKGCTDTTVKVINILPNPEAQFLVNDSIQCFVNNDFAFENRSTLSFGKFTTRWNYGDGTVREAVNGRYTYQNPGIYTVNQIVISGELCADTARKIVKVTEQPKVSFTLNQQEQCSKYNSFSGVNTSSYGGSETVTYYWDMGNGDTSSNAALLYQYSLYGAYPLKLLAVTSEGCRDSFVRNIKVLPQGISAYQLFKDTFCFYNNVVRFNNQSRVDGDRFAGFRWDFGDGFFQNVADNNPVDYSFNKTGTFNFKLITTTLGLCKDTSEGKITILDMPESKGISNVGISCFKQQNFEFTDISTNPTKVTTRQWIVNRTMESDAPVFPFKFKSSGKQFATLVIQDQFGCTDSSVVEVDILNSPEANFSINRTQQCLETNEFNFENTSKGTNGKEGFWQPEALSGAFQIDLLYNYFKAGTYGVKLTVYNDDGCEDTVVKNITVYPTPFGELNLTGVCINDPILFDANSSIETGVIQKHEWVLGDGRFSSLEKPQHVYTIIGLMPVSLTLTSDKGCILKIADTVEVYPLPSPEIGTFTENLNINTPELSVYDSSSTGPYMDYTWDFGDGSDLQYDFEVSHKYRDTGWFTVTLTAESFEGCLNTVERDFYVAPEFNLLFPTAFSPNGDGINDIYQILGKFQSIKHIDILIKDELGNTVYRSNDVNMQWNGNYLNSNNQAPSGTYIIQVLLTDLYKKQFQTSQRINLIR